MISYAEGAAEDNSRHVAYFDKVDGVLKDQAFPFAVWGWITRTADGVHVDSFIQVPTLPAALLLGRLFPCRGRWAAGG